MLIIEITDRHNAYHKLDLLASRFVLLYKHLRNLSIKMKDYKQHCIKSGMYGQWVEILNDLDEELNEFIDISTIVLELIKYFDAYRQKYVSRQQIITMMQEILLLRHRL